jgi:hypothetical protein
MAGVGRGRGATLPAWMLDMKPEDRPAPQAPERSQAPPPAPANGQFADPPSDRREEPRDRGSRDGGSRDRGSRDRGSRDRGSRQRSSSPRRRRSTSRDRDRGGGRDRDRDRDRSRDSGSRGGSSGGWKPRGKDAKSNFDVMPLPGAAPLPPGVGAASAASGGGLPGMMSMSEVSAVSDSACLLYAC